MQTVFFSFLGCVYRNSKI